MFKQIIAALLMLTLLTGCTPSVPQPPQADQPPPNSQPQDTLPPANPGLPPLAEEVSPSIGGISLGDSAEAIDNNLGSDYKAIYIEDGGYFGEPYEERTYSNGLKLIIGKNSAKVLQISSTAANTPTELAVKVGDTASTALAKYKASYLEPVSPHGAGKLEGWFEVGNGQLLILDFNATDETMVNLKIEPTDRVERLILAYSQFMD